MVGGLVGQTLRTFKKRKKEKETHTNKHRALYVQNDASRNDLCYINISSIKAGGSSAKRNPDLELLGVYLSVFQHVLIPEKPFLGNGENLDQNGDL